MKVLFLCPYPTGVAPSQRFRFEQYLRLLNKNNIQYEIMPFTSGSSWAILFQPGNIHIKLGASINGFFKRCLTFFRLHKFDYIFIHREASPVGPPVLEWAIAQILKKKIIYDFDDAIWLTDKTQEGWLEKKIRYRSKVASICRRSYKVSVGNRYLQGYARKFNTNVILNPTTIDTDFHKPVHEKNRLNPSVNIGWTGSHSTLKFLVTLAPVLNALVQKHSHVNIVVIADQQPPIALSNLIFRKWSRETEIDDLASIDIGIMPLPNNEWSQGKCGFKALQYMALEIPAVVSPVGVNTEIVEDGIQGYLCSSESEWFSKLERLILNEQERWQMGKLGRQKVIQHYSVVSNSSNFLSFFQ